MYLSSNPSSISGDVLNAFVLCFSFSFWYLIASFCLALRIKMEFYKFVALENGLINLTVMDEFYLYDIPANPINIPAFMIINRPDKE